MPQYNGYFHFIVTSRAGRALKKLLLSHTHTPYYTRQMSRVIRGEKIERKREGEVLPYFHVWNVN